MMRTLRALFALALFLVAAGLHAQTANVAWFNVKAYGAKGDASTDDCAAIQKAITAAQNVSGGVVYLPHTKPNYYLCNSAGLTVTSAIRIVGDQMLTSEIRTTNTAITLLTVDSGTATAVVGFSMSDVFVNQQGGAGTSVGLVFVDVHSSQLQRVQINGFNIGWRLKGGTNGGSQSAYINSSTDSLFTSNATIAIDAQAASNSLSILGGTVGSGATGIKVVDSADPRIQNVNLSTNTLVDIDLDSSATLKNTNAVILGNHFEGTNVTAGNIRIGSTSAVNTVNIIGNTFGYNAATAPVNALKANNLYVAGNLAYNLTTGSIVTQTTVVGFTEIGTQYKVVSAPAQAVTTVSWESLNSLSSNVTYTTNNTPADVTGMSFTVAANDVWIADFYIDAGAALATTGAIFAINAPAGATINVNAGQMPAVVSTSGGYSLSSQTILGNLDFTTTLCTSGTNAFFHISVWVSNGATGGTVQLRASQSTSSGTALTLRKGSHFFARRNQ